MSASAVLDAPAAPLLAPSGDSRAVEKAVAASIADGFGPETFLWINFWRPDGGVRVRYAWTHGGGPLGDRIDHLAVAAGLDAADWLHIADRHEQMSQRGRVEVKAYPLRPVLADVQAGIRAPEERREGVRRILRKAAEMTGQQPRSESGFWIGFGPGYINRPA